MDLQVKHDDEIDVFRDTPTFSHNFVIADDYLLVYRCDALADVLRSNPINETKDEDESPILDDSAVPVAAYASFDWIKEYKPCKD